MVYKKKAKVQIEHIHPLAIHKHIKRHFAKHARKVADAYDSLSHKFAHLGELVVVLVFCVYGAMFAANFTGNIEQVRRDNGTEVAAALSNAIAHPENILTSGNLISVWNIDTSVYTSFSSGYCTYGAARISPEFFPYVDTKTQMRTRGGNAVDRCENAAATGFKVGLTPSVGSLIVYNGGGKFGPYGHVGKVVHYDRGLNKIIVRDMNRVGLYTMSDHRDTADNSNVKCFIYPSKSVSIPLPEAPVIDPTPSVPVVAPVVPTTPVVTPSVPEQETTPPADNSHGSSTTPVVPTTPVVKPSVPEVITPVTPSIEQASLRDIDLDMDQLSDLAAHLAGQWDIKAQLWSTKVLKVGDEAILTLTVQDQQTHENINGLLPLGFSLISTQDTIDVDYATISFLQEGKITIHIKGIKAGSSTLVINFGDETIGKVSFTVK